MSNYKANLLIGLPIVMGVLVFSFFIHGGADFRLIPVHHDDYTNLSSSIFDMFQKENFVRPVSTVIIALLAYLGEYGYLFGQFLFLSAYVLLVSFFLARFFEVKPNAIFLISSVLLVSTIPNLVEYHFYTGLMTNLSSAVFGMLAMVIWQEYKGEKAKLEVFSLLVLSAFAKEDFILPFVLYTAYLYFEESNSEKKTVNLKWSLLSLLVLFFSFLFNKIAGSAFVSSDTSHYAISLRPLDIIRGYEYYLFRNEYFTACLLTLLTLSSISIFISRDKIVNVKRSFVALIVVLSMVGPYTLLPNHYADYYSFMWFVWVVILIAISASATLERLINKKPYDLVLFSMSIAFLFYYFTAIFNVQRVSIVNWYQNQQSITKNVLESLSVIQPKESDTDKEVYILTPPSLSPWSHSSGQYLERVFKFKNDWIVYVPSSDGFYKIGSNVGTVSINSLSSFKMDSLNAPVFKFRMDGTAERGYTNND